VDFRSLEYAMLPTAPSGFAFAHSAPASVVNRIAKSVVTATNDLKELGTILFLPPKASVRSKRDDQKQWCSHKTVSCDAGCCWLSGSVGCHICAIWKVLSCSAPVWRAFHSRQM
jgi:hypothetical protein